MTRKAWIISRWRASRLKSILALIEHVLEYTIDELANRPV